MAKATREEWKRRVERWRASGLTAASFAAREGLNAGTLRWWSSQLGREVEAPSFVDVTRLVLPRSQPPASVEVVIRDAVSVRVQPGFDAELLRAVVAALELR